MIDCLNIFMEKVKQLEFDISLVSCPGLGNHIALEIYNLDKSAINMEHYLDQYFGLYKENQKKQMNDIFKLYDSPNWLSY